MADVTLCEWFAMCDRPAEYIVAHPVLGGVPACGRCLEQVGHRLEEAEKLEPLED